MKKTLYFLVLFILGFLAFSCSQSAVSIIESSTTGQIGIKMPVYVNFKDSVILHEASLQEAFSVSPSADLEISIIANNRIRLLPRSPLKSNTPYKVKINTGKLTAGQFKGNNTFEFQTFPFEYSANSEGLMMNDDRESYTLKGSVETSDYTDSSFVESHLKIEGLTSPKITWNHSQDGITHQYRIENIEILKEKSYRIDLTFTFEESQSLTVEVPAKGEYRILEHLVQTEPQAIIVTFSDLLNARVDFQSLIDFKANFRTSVDKNKLFIYPENTLVGEYVITLSSNILNKDNKQLAESSRLNVSFASRKPAVKFINSGSVLPSANNMNIIFQSINYAKAQVRIREIYPNNVVQFFQSCDYSGDDYYNLDLVSRVIRDTTIQLGQGALLKANEPTNYSLDISKLLRNSRKSVYKIEIRGIDPMSSGQTSDGEDNDDDYYSEYYFGNYKTYADRSRYIFASDIGILCKSTGENEYLIYTTDLITAQPKGNVKVQFYDAVNQKQDEGTTDSDGKIKLKGAYTPNLVIASAGEDVSYLKIKPGQALSLSNFDVAGTQNPKGIKGFIFGERGVWRPGDDIYLTFIVTSADGPLPGNHSAKLSLYNPDEQLVETVVSNTSSGGIYTFRLKTAASAPTGLWKAIIDYGGTSFRKTLRIDVLKANRMKIELNLGQNNLISANDFTGNLNAKWLHGAPAAGMKVTVDAQLAQMSTRFKGYDKYSFDDKASHFESEDREIFSGITDTEGNLKLSSQSLASLKKEAPGFINGKFTVKVFEKGGDFSIDQTALTISPYETYLGVQIPMQKHPWGEEYLDSEKDHVINVVSLDQDGTLQKNPENFSVDIYKIDSYWWWDAESSNSQASYARNAMRSIYKTLDVRTANGKGSAVMKWNTNDYGYYLIRVTGNGTGHAASTIVYVCSSDYSGNVSSVSSAATRLDITTDKEKYQVGERAKITIPSAPGAQALVSIESGPKVKESFWVKCSDRQTSFELPVKEGMAPNIYLSVTFIQPHSRALNDAPIRMFGVKRICVEDKNLLLTPVIEVPQSVKPESAIEIKVKEKDGRPMSYVLALVDEGLLGLTRFQTPNPYTHFNAIEALEVSTWDLFDYVIGAYGGKIEQLFAIGGDSEITNKGALKARRFPPVVKFIGIQELGAGRINKHKITLPPYFGSVRVMVIAANGKAFGAAEKNVEVKKPLLVQATLPRVISTDEEVELPVTVFALEKGVGKVNVEVNTNRLFTVVGSRTAGVTLNQPGEEVVWLRLKAGKQTGIGKVTVNASCGNDQSRYDLEIDLREPNPYVAVSQDYILKAGEQLRVKPLKNSGKAMLELSSLPPMDLSRHLEYLVRYPHGCIEQITSAAFPQLYIPQIASCDKSMLEDVERNIKSTLSRLGSYQLSNGAFAYWAGATSASYWGTVYATHFMLEAGKYGYNVNQTILSKALAYLKSTRIENNLTQAYSQYVLALGGKADRGGMNKLREKPSALSADAKWMLAAAYALDGNKAVAEELIASTRKEGTIQKVNYYDETFNSPQRQKAVVLMTLMLTGDQQEAFKTALDLSRQLQKERRLNTQSIAWMLNTLSQFSLTAQKGIHVQLGSQTVKSEKSIVRNPLTGETVLKNQSSAELYAVISQLYVPAKGEEMAAGNGLALRIQYTDVNGNPLNPQKMAASTDFYAHIAVTNTSGTEDYTNLALTYMVPSGWEIASGREMNNNLYQDIRDDRVLSYFNLSRGSRKEISIRLTAAYKGKFYLPAAYCESMYDNTVNALEKGKWIEIK